MKYAVFTRLPSEGRLYLNPQHVVAVTPSLTSSGTVISMSAVDGDGKSMRYTVKEDIGFVVAELEKLTK